MIEGASYRPVTPTAGTFEPIGIDQATITDGFWAVRQRVNSAATLSHCHEWMDRLGWIGNFTAASEGRLPHDREGVVFTDSDVYKLMEAAAWESGRSGSAGANEMFDSLTEIIAPIQEEDGYLNTVFGRPGQPARYSDLEWGHELYCYGHMLQAAVARSRTSGEDQFVDVARRVADHVCDTFGPRGIDRVGGHPEIELGLIEMARETGEERYLAQAKWFIDRRGYQTLADIHWGRSYFQDDEPVRSRPAFVGHAVRALYLAAAAVDVAVESDDSELLEAIVQQFDRTLGRRTYLTGGMGSHHDGEMFGEDFALPPDRAYSETCAGIASVMLSWRLLLATGEPKYADLIERTLFNVVATSPSPDGRAFFYANPLHQRVPGQVPDPDAVSNRAASSLREPWFRVSCCPTNVARTFATLGSYLATTDKGGIQIHQYSTSTIKAHLDDVGPVAVEVTTGYPNAGKITVRVTKTANEPWSLSLRVPGWTERAILRDGERNIDAPRGVVEVQRRFEVGDELILDLDVSPRWTYADPRIDAIRGCVAVEAGPLVMCVESVDLPSGADTENLRIDPDDGLTMSGERVSATGATGASEDEGWPYTPDISDPPTEPTSVALTPYHAWGNRGPATMRVWIPVI